MESDKTIEPFYPEPCLDYNNRNGIHETKQITRNATHPSIVKIIQNVYIDERFKLQDITPNGMKTYVHKLDPTKASIENDLPAKILIGSSEISSNHLSSIYNHSKTDNSYPLLFKYLPIII